MNLSFIINFKNVSSIEWKIAYDGIKKIIDAYPIELMRLKTDYPLDIKRVFWTNEIEFLDKKNKCIQIKGDLFSMEYGSTFTFFEDLKIQKSQKENVDYNIDTYYVEPNNEYFHCINGYEKLDIFNNYDTCGHPYSYCILAIGIYLEHCFYEKSYLAGDFNTKQIEIILDWLNDVFNESIKTPKTVKHNVIWNKLSVLYENKIDTITRFWFLSVQSSSNKLKFLLSQDKKTTEDFLIKKLSSYNSVHQWGFIDLLIPYLIACEDLEVFLEFYKKLQTVINSENFSLFELLKMLIDKGICEKPFKNETLKELYKQKASLETGMEVLNKMIFKMSGISSSIDIYISPKELLEVFAYFEPQNGIKFKNLLDKNIEKNKEKRDKQNLIIEKSLESFINEFDEDNFENKYNKLKFFGYKNEDYFIDEVKSQSRCFKDFEETAKVIGKAIIKNLNIYKIDYPLFFNDLKDKKSILKEIYISSEKRGFSITEQAWKSIDNENDIEILEGIWYYFSLSEREINFWAIRNHFLENSKYWNFLKKQ
jgi:hypothetical protein